MKDKPEDDADFKPKGKGSKVGVAGVDFREARDVGERAASRCQAERLAVR
jgi:hypothetical protein